MKKINLYTRHIQGTFIIGFVWVVMVFNVALATDNGYLINKGDKLRIDVWQEESLSVDVLVSPDGNISFPLVGLVSAAGQTLDKLKIQLQEKLSRFIPDPELNISLITIEGNVFYVIGEVARPGPFIMVKDLHVMQALSMAGGLTPFAAKSDIYILRRTADGAFTSIPFDYDDLEDGDNLDSSILLNSGDTIIVP